MKKNEHEKRGTDLIELYGKYESGEFYLPKLSYELTKRNIVKNNRTEKEYIDCQSSPTAIIFDWNKSDNFFIKQYLW